MKPKTRRGKWLAADRDLALVYADCYKTLPHVGPLTAILDEMERRCLRRAMRSHRELLSVERDRPGGL